MGRGRRKCGIHGKGNGVRGRSPIHHQRRGAPAEDGRCRVGILQYYGTQISTTKLRLFILGTQGLKVDDARGDTIVHTFQW